MKSLVNGRTVGVRSMLLAGAGAAGIVLAATPAFAQQVADSGAGNEIVVTGLRHSMNSSVEIKRTNDGIVEAVVAADIGKLPDLSVAETLARLPGVAAQRVDGRAQDLSIRGMGPQFGVTLLNGNEMVSTGDDRSFEYDQLPGELVNSMVVYKTSDVSLSSQGLAGTIDIRTVQPLSVKKRQIALNARFEVNSYGKLVPGISNKGERLSASYVDQFMDGHLGIALGYTHLGSPVEKKYFNPWDFDTADNLYLIDAAGNTLGSAMSFDGFETGTQSIKTARDSFLAVAEYKADNGFHSTLNYFHSQFTQNMRGDEVVGVPAGWAPGTESHVTFGATPFTLNTTNATLGLVFRGNDRKDKIDALDWNNDFALGEWKVRADASWSRAHRRESIAEMYATNPTPSSYTVTFPAGFRSFGQVSNAPLNFASTSAFQLATYFWGPPAGYLTQVDLKDETKSGKLSIRREWSDGALSFVDAGATYAQRTKQLNNVGTAYDYVGGGTACFIGTCTAIPAGLVSGTSPMNFNGLGNVFFIDAIQALGGAPFVKLASDALNPRWNWSVDEKTFTGYARMGFRGKVLIPWRGTLGVQVVSTDQSATGLYIDGNGVQTPNTGSAKYTDVLPSLVLTGDVGAKTKLRLGVARATARPNMSDLRAAVNASVGAVPLPGGSIQYLWSGSGGNPKLKPWLSTDFDLSVERYFAPGTYVSLALYDKMIERGILTQTTTFDFSGFTNTSGHAATSNIGSFDQPINVNGGWVRGAEFTVSVDGKALSPVLEGFGLNANYSYADSSLPALSVAGYVVPGKLEGLSTHVINGTLFYERHGIQLRIGERYRSGYSATRHNAFKYVIDTIRPEFITDLQAGYTFQSGALKGVNILAEVNNVFDEPYSATQTVNGQTALKEFHKFGRQFLVGLAYKF